MKKILFLIAIFISVSAYSQIKVRKICGTVTEEGKNEPLPGVNIIIKGTNTGTTTDIDGKYCIEVPIGSVIQFVGFDNNITEYYVGPEKTELFSDRRKILAELE